MKNHHLALPALVILCIMLAGCPYESQFPLEPTAVQNIDSSLLGTWCKYSFADDSVFTTVTFKANSAKNYLVTITNPNLSNDGLFNNGSRVDTSKYVAYSTLIAGQAVYTCTEDSGKYFFAVIHRPEHNRMSILLLPDVMAGRKTINSSEELKTLVTRFLTQNSSKISYDNDAWLNNLVKVK